MSNPLTQSDTATEVDDLLAAYLDNELPDQDRAEVEARLAVDEAFRQRLDEMDRAWEMLDSLPKTELDDERFLRSTVEMITVAASREIAQYQRKQRYWGWLGRGGAVLAVCLLVLFGYAATRRAMTRDDRMLIENLSVIENVDEYQRVEEIEFLELLRAEGLFTGESADES